MGEWPRQSAITLLVRGTHIVRTGILRVYGSQLRRVLSHSVARRPQAFAAGIGVTALRLELIADMKRLNSLFCGGAYAVLEDEDRTDAEGSQPLEPIRPLGNRAISALPTREEMT